jgi:hypothetical protein
VPFGAALCEAKSTDDGDRFFDKNLRVAVVNETTHFTLVLALHSHY